MPETDDVRPRLTAVLRAYLALGPDEELIVDEDGDVPIRYESAMYFVRLLERDPPLVQVFSHVLRDVPESPELYEAINRINQKVVSARVFWFANNIVAALETPAESLDVEELRHACWAIGSLAAWADTEMQKRFGGRMAGSD